MKPLLTFILFTLIVSHSQAQLTTYYSPNGIAINGYDPVAYFSERIAVEGLKHFVYSWQGAKWRFASQANLDSFKANPEKYAPQFGGYCAYGVSENHKSPTEPSAFTVLDDKLYLNYSLKVKDLWMKDTKGRIQNAERNWATLKDKEK